MNKDEFREYIINLLKDTPNDSDFEQVGNEPQVKLGYDDGYCWEITTIALADSNTLDVNFDVGSVSGRNWCWYREKVCRLKSLDNIY